MLDIVIPVAGLGLRMRSPRPKCLTQLPNGETLLDRQIRILGDVFPYSRFIIVGGYGVEAVSHHIPSRGILVLNEKYESTNVSRSLGLALAQCGSEALIVYGDIFFGHSFFEDVSGKEGEGSLLVTHPDPDHERESEVGVTVVNGLATHLSFGVAEKWAHVVYLRGRELELFRSAAQHHRKAKFFGYELLNEVIDRGGVFTVVRSEDPVFGEIDSLSDLRRSRNVLQQVSGGCTI